MSPGPGGAGTAAETPGRVELNRVSLEFEVDSGWVPVLLDLSLEVAAGEFVCIVGPSGCGKTTLLRMVDGLLFPTRGEVRVDGHPVRAPGADRAFVFQSPRLLPWRTVLGNIAFASQVRGVAREAARTRAGELARLVGLEGFEDYHPPQLSIGMQQRVNLARAISIDPSILLMDEPFAALDAQTRELMQEELLRIWMVRPQTVLFVTHQLDEAVYLADRVVVLTRNPCRVKEVLPVPLPRPRALELRRRPDFTGLVDRLWTLMREETENTGQRRKP